MRNQSLVISDFEGGEADSVEEAESAQECTVYLMTLSPSSRNTQEDSFSRIS